MPSRDPFAALRREYRELVPAARRRKSLVLLGHGPDKPAILAVVRPEDRGALRPLIERLSGNGVHLRSAQAEDGYLDVGLLWRTGDLVEVGDAVA